MSDAPRRLLLLFAVFAVTASVLFVVRGRIGGYGLYDLLRGKPLPADTRERHKPETFTLPEEAPLTTDEVPLLTRISAESSQVAESVMPSVVSIATAKTVRGADGRQAMHKRLGAGVIVTHQGHVITANHVVHNVEAIVVRMANDRVLPVEIVGLSPRFDIAVLKIIAPDKDESFQPLPFIPDSDSVRQGEFVFSFGNPYGLRRSSDFGILSSKERSFNDGTADLFQTSTRMLPGHSGGPLVNVQGQIIGINRANFGPNKYADVGMAIVANDARDILDAILKRGKPVYGHLGVHIEIPAIYGHLSAFDNDMRYPLQVNSVEPGSAAEKAGLRRGDVLTEFAGHQIENFNAFKRLVRQRLPGDRVSIGLRRDGEEMLLAAVMAERDPQDIFSRWEGWTEERAVGFLRRSLGVDVSNLSAAQKQKLGLPAAAGGVVVTGVHPRRPAHGLLRAGDIIEICGGETFRNAKQFVALIEQRPEARIDLLVMRPLGKGGARTNLVLEIEPEVVEPAEPAADPVVPTEKTSA